MVRTSKRQAVISRLNKLIEHAIKRCLQLKSMGIPTHREDEFVHSVARTLAKVKSSRYLTKRGCYRKKQPRFWIYLRDDHGEALTDREFKFHFRLTRSCFWQLVQLLKNHAEFQNLRPD